MTTDTLIHALEQFNQACIRYYSNLNLSKGEFLEEDLKRLEKSKIRLSHAIDLVVSERVNSRIKELGYHDAEN